MSRGNTYKTQIVEEQGVCQTLSAGKSRSGKGFDFLLLHPTHIQVQSTKSDSGPRQVHISGDVTMPCISIISTQP